MIYLIVLASGLSQRMGQPKLLMPWGKKTILRTVIEPLTHMKEIGIKVVLNPGISGYKRQLEGLSVDMVWNHDAALGISTSICAGIHTLPNDAQAAIIVLADQPEMADAFVNPLVEMFQTNHNTIIQARYRGIPGHPVLFAKEWFPFLLMLTGDQGAKNLLKEHVDKIKYVDFDHAPLQDIDTLQDYSRLFPSNNNNI